METSASSNPHATGQGRQTQAPLGERSELVPARPRPVGGGPQRLPARLPGCHGVRDPRPGKTWEDWGQHLPHEPVNALVESADRAGWWVVGTDGGAYLTTDAGTSFSMLHRDLPRVPVHDLVIQERENDLVIGTHGRGIYVLTSSPLMAKKDGSPRRLENDTHWPLKRNQSTWYATMVGRARMGVVRTENPSARTRGFGLQDATQAKLELRFIPTAPEAPDSSATTGGGASAILDQLQEGERICGGRRRTGPCGWPSILGHPDDFTAMALSSRHVHGGLGHHSPRGTSTTRGHHDVDVRRWID